VVPTTVVVDLVNRDTVGEPRDDEGEGRDHAVPKAKPKAGYLVSLGTSDVLQDIWVWSTACRREDDQHEKEDKYDWDEFHTQRMPLGLD